VSARSQEVKEEVQSKMEKKSGLWLILFALVHG
jgi:hypothetical protein